MGGEVDTNGLGNTVIDGALHHKLAVHCADRIAAQHPHPLDDVMPRLAGRLIAQDPTVRADVLEVLEATGYTRKEQP